MASIYTFKEAKITGQGLWVKSADGGPEVFLTPSESMALAEGIIKQGRPKSMQRSTSTMQRSASTGTQRSTDVTGKVQSVGKSSYQRDDMKEYAQDLAKKRALAKLDGQLKSLANQGKTWNSCKTTTQLYQQGYTIQCIAQATLGD